MPDKVIKPTLTSRHGGQADNEIVLLGGSSKRFGRLIPGTLCINIERHV